MTHINNLWDKMPRFLTIQRVVPATTTGLRTVKSEMSMLPLNGSNEVHLCEV
jgi:hypothetical protein